MPPIASFQTHSAVIFQMTAESRHVVKWEQSTNYMSDDIVVTHFFKKSIRILENAQVRIRNKYPKLFNR